MYGFVVLRFVDNTLLTSCAFSFLRKLFLWVFKMKTDEKRDYAIKLLQEKHMQKGCLPKRSDFSDSDVCLIKQKLGPWPRALEAAGLKAPPAVSRIEHNRAKRKRAKQKRKEIKKQQNISLSHDGGQNEEDS